ncbi:hypothetical protein NSERUTF1_7694 [Nocardia seriolae]|nr:hypothetical protein NSERUTF1_7694 [Nocardia seriolae]
MRWVCLPPGGRVRELVPPRLGPVRCRFAATSLTGRAHEHLLPERRKSWCQGTIAGDRPAARPMLIDVTGCP